MKDAVKLKIDISTIDVDRSFLQMSLDVSVDLKKFSEGEYSKGTRAIEEMIQDEVTSRVVEIYMTENLDKIVNKIDIETIVKRVQFEVVKKLGH